MIQKYIFYIRNKEIRTFFVRNGKFELMRCHGEEGMFLEESLFWRWWEETSSINKEKHGVDFCFIADDAYDFSNLATVYKFTQTTTWTLDKIEEFLRGHGRGTTIELEYRGRTSPIKLSLNKDARLFEENIKEKLFLTTCSGSIFNMEEELSTLEECGESELRKYYREKNMRNLKNR